MPHYSYRKTFTSGKARNSQESLTMPCAWGVITDVTISFPAGCQGLCHVHIDDGLHQIFPTNPEGDYALDDYTLPIHDEYNLLPSKRKLHLRGWNEDETYDHTISVTFKVVPFEQFSPVESVLVKILSILERIFGKAKVK